MTGKAHAAHPVPRPVMLFVTGLALVVISQLAAPRTRVEITSDGSVLGVVAAGSRLTARAAPIAVERLQLTAMRSIDPPGGASLSVETAEGGREQ